MCVRRRRSQYYPAAKRHIGGPVSKITFTVCIYPILLQPNYCMATDNLGKYAFLDSEIILGHKSEHNSIAYGKRVM